MVQVVHLVRHGRPLVDTAKSNAEWELDPAGMGDIEELRRSGRLPEHASWFSSPEPKAYGTIRALTSSPITPVEELCEMRRPAGPWLGAEAWHSRVARSMAALDEPAAEGWETGRATTDRIVRAVREIVVSSPSDRPIVLGGHGTAFTLLVAALTGREPDLQAWKAMSMPDHCVLEVDGDRAAVRTPWLSGRLGRAPGDR